MHWLTALFGFACLVTVVVARGRDGSFLAVLMLAGWAFTGVVWNLDALTTLALLDGLTLGLCLVLRYGNRDRWLSLVTIGASVQLVSDMTYEWLGDDFYFGYMVVYNLTFAAMLVAIGSTGWPDVVRWIADRLHRRVPRARMVH